MVKGQITKHEWPKGFGWKICPHCNLKKLSYGAGIKPEYTLADGSRTFTEPRCITRKTQTDVTKDK